MGVDVLRRYSGRDRWCRGQNRFLRLRGRPKKQQKQSSKCDTMFHDRPRLTLRHCSTVLSFTGLYLEGGLGGLTCVAQCEAAMSKSPAQGQEYRSVFTLYSEDGKRAGRPILQQSKRIVMPPFGRIEEKRPCNFCLTDEIMPSSNFFPKSLDAMVRRRFMCGKCEGGDQVSVRIETFLVKFLQYRLEVCIAALGLRIG